jgi:hypothetical protein
VGSPILTKEPRGSALATRKSIGKGLPTSYARDLSKNLHEQDPCVVHGARESQQYTRDQPVEAARKPEEKGKARDENAQVGGLVERKAHDQVPDLHKVVGSDGVELDRAGRDPGKAANAYELQGIGPDRVAWDQCQERYDERDRKWDEGLTRPGREAGDPQDLGQIDGESDEQQAREAGRGAGARNEEVFPTGQRE